MTPADAADFIRALTVLAETFSESVSEERYQAYFRALSDLPLEAALSAIDRAIGECRYFPRPIELRELAGMSGPDLGEAYAALQKAMRSGPYRAQPVLPEALAIMVDRLGGWQRLFTFTEEHLWLRFRQLYEPVRVAVGARGMEHPALPPPSDGPAVQIETRPASREEALAAMQRVKGKIEAARAAEVAKIAEREAAQREKLRDQARILREQESA